ncbi:MAG: hypothetical protein ACI35V_11530 [Sphingobacterium composti]|uniref:hypothetical protein n=1 Tax=Sphingobacterium composti TaxID=363260 RepID=UPI001356A508|nr:hypothetical protein [Sphingobacterium composti Ten et al. 2007 non Yoo et al. 2007]
MSFQIINLDAINQSMLGNPDLIKELVNLYIVQSPIDFNALEESLATGDKSLIRERTHHIKPTMQYIGALGLLQDFQALENLAREDAPLSEIETLFQAIKPKFQLMLTELTLLSTS